MWEKKISLILHSNTRTKYRNTHTYLHIYAPLPSSSCMENKRISSVCRRTPFPVNKWSRHPLFLLLCGLKRSAFFSLCNYLASSVVTPCVPMTHPTPLSFCSACFILQLPSGIFVTLNSSLISATERENENMVSNADSTVCTAWGCYWSSAADQRWHLAASLCLWLGVIARSQRDETDMLVSEGPITG